ncbi:MAG: lysophospholipid acyltransferase family protein [Actinobacteria bacterium]|nr:lysophospholipid acyltransferase family protein [Actinomycetota bacterium]
MLNYLGYKFLEFIAIVLPYPLAYAVAIAVARLWYAMGTNVGIIKKNISRVLNIESGDPEVHRISVKVFTNWGKNIVDFLRQSVISKKTLISRVGLDGIENLNTALKEKKGVVIITSHIGNFEWAGSRLAADGYKIWGLSLFRKSSRVNRFFENKRMTKGLKTLYINRMLNIFRLLKNNEILAIPSDWDPTGKASRPFKFFGRVAKLPIGALQIALKSGAPLVPIYASRDGRYTHRVAIEKPIELDREGDKEELISKNMEKILAEMEVYIREHITEWELFHNIWID